MKTPRELFIEKYRHRESDLDDVAGRLTKQWGHSIGNETRDAESIMCWLAGVLSWRNYWYGLGTVWMVIGLLHALTMYQSSPPTSNQDVEWSGDLDLILHHYAAAQYDDLEWMNDFHVVPNAPVEQQVPRSDAAPGPQGWFDIRSRKGRAFPWSPIPNEARKRHLECGGSTPLWIRQGDPTEHSSTFTIPLLKISSTHRASRESGGVRGGGLECCMVLGFADRIQSGVEPPHSRVGLAYLGGFGVC